MTVFRWGASTHPGRVRSSNQDAVLAERGLFAVADGMGGHRAGETAARLTVESLTGGSYGQLEELVEAVTTANASVHGQAAGNPDLQGMGTTVTALVLTGEPPTGLLVNVGDSRAYRLREGELVQLTDDHSYVAELIREGSINAQEALSHPYRNMLTRAIGIESDVRVDGWELEVAEGDRFLLCSDGLVNELDDGQIAAVLRRLGDPGEAARELIRQANERGGRDNVTVVVADVLADDDAPADLDAADTDLDAEPTDHGADGPETPTAPLDAPVPAVEGPSTEPLPTTDELAAGLAEERRSDEADDGSPLLTVRTVVFTFAVLAVVAGAIGAVGMWARSGVHVGFLGDEVVIYEGREASVLWFEPTVTERTGIFRSELPEAVVVEIEGGRSADSVDDARAQIAELQAELDARGASAADGEDTGAADTEADGTAADEETGPSS